MKTVSIGGRDVGMGCPTYVIAEVGINHNGDVKLARETIDAAIRSGADAVKLQTYSTDGFIHPENPIFNAIRSCELTKDEYRELFEYARSKGGVIFSTPECIADIRFLKSLDPPAMKIAAMDMNYREFVQEAARLGKPVILSTGMSYFHEVANAVRWIEETGNDRIILLHCVSCYPTPPQECNLSVMSVMEAAFGYPTGFSDHTVGFDIPFAAACMGAKVIEKHFTLDQKLPGPDHAGSADPEDLARLVSAMRSYEQAIGDGIKRPSVSEEATRLKKRRSVYAKRDLQKGDILKAEDVNFLTPSVPESQMEDLETFLGRTLKEAVRKNGLISSAVLV
jgi:N,N'-diacetyllegionaminate synthase